MTIFIRTLSVGMPQEIHDDSGKPWVSGFIKQAVQGPVNLRHDNLDGDGQADRSVHGGPEKALLAYCAEHYPRWNEELGRSDLRDGSFGENLSLCGVDENQVAIGAIYRINDVLIQVSQTRQPCWKLARRCALPSMPAKAIANGRLGWYFRVLHPGEITAGDQLQLVENPSPSWTIARINRAYFAPRTADRAPLKEVITLPGVSPEFISLCHKRLGEDDSSN